MPPVIPDPEKIRPFADFHSFHNWLAQHGGIWDEVWVQFFKKGSGVETITYEEAVRAGLCWGWIDGIKKKHDEKSYLLRFTPRRRKSIWSVINTRHVERLIEEGLNLSRDQRRRLQEYLTVLGFDTHGIDGLFGPNTRSAVQQWQASIGATGTGLSLIHISEPTRPY